MYAVIHPKMPPNARKILVQLGYTLIETQKSNNVDASPVFPHPDIQIHALSPTCAITAPELFSYYRARLPENIHILCGINSISGTYPKDCAYNVAVIGEYLICNPKTVDPVLMNYYQELNFHIIPVKQGYTKCNALYLGNHCLITEDQGIYHDVLRNNPPFDVKLVPGGEICLPPYPNGFLGGSTAFHQKNLFLFGNLHTLSYQNLLKEEAKKHKISLMELWDGTMEDLGGIIFFSS